MNELKFCLFLLLYFCVVCISVCALGFNHYKTIIITLFFTISLHVYFLYIHCHVFLQWAYLIITKQWAYLIITKESL